MKKQRTLHCHRKKLYPKNKAFRPVCQIRRISTLTSPPSDRHSITVWVSAVLTITVKTVKLFANTENLSNFGFMFCLEISAQTQLIETCASAFAGVEPKKTRDSLGHVMISYNHSTRALCMRIAQELRVSSNDFALCILDFVLWINIVAEALHRLDRSR